MFIWSAKKHISFHNQFSQDPVLSYEGVSYSNPSQKASNDMWFVVCHGHPIIENPTPEQCTQNPCAIIAQETLNQLNNASPEQTLSHIFSSHTGTFTLLVGIHKNKQIWVRSTTHCFATPDLHTITSHPHIAQDQLTLIPYNTTITPTKPLTTKTFLFEDLPNRSSYCPKLPPTHPMGPIKNLFIFAEGLSLCVSRMIKDRVEYSQNIQVFIAPLNQDIPWQKATKEQPFFILPNAFSDMIHKINHLPQHPHIHILNPTPHLIQKDCVIAPYFHPVQQWRMFLSMLNEPIPPLEPKLHDAVIKQLQSFLPLLTKHPSRFYLGKNIFSAFARVCSHYDQHVTYSVASHYPSGELKHGPLALVDEHITAIVFCPFDDLFFKNVSNIHEVLSRKGHIIAITDEKGAEFFQKELPVPVLSLPFESPEIFLMHAWTVIHELVFMLKV